MSTFASTAMPMVRIKPAMPGRENEKPNMAITPNRSTALIARATMATRPASR